MQRPGGNPVQEFTSRKFLLTAAALATVCYMAITTKDPQWGVSIIGVLGQYAWANYVESKNVVMSYVTKDVNGGGGGPVGPGE